jgi:ribose-phosphate pyrophosphokinase
MLFRQTQTGASLLNTMQLRIFSGSSHPEFASRIAAALGVSVGKTESQVFSNNNRFVRIDEPVRGDDVYLVQTSCNPVDSHLMELLMLTRTLRDASAQRVTVVLPYFPYVRSDKRDQPRVCLTARLVADLLAAAGADRVLTMDLHSPQIQGFFSIHIDELLASPSIINHLTKNWDLRDAVLVASDSGAAKMLKIYADALNLPVAIMDKRRESNNEQPTIKGVIGSVTGKKAILIDDEASSGRTLVRDAAFLVEHAGAVSVDACVVHAILGGKAVEELNQSPINRFVITNTIPTDNKLLKNKEIVDVTPQFAECIKRMHENKSILNLNAVS